jgi:hypothetical protein
MATAGSVTPNGEIIRSRKEVKTTIVEKEQEP